MIPSMLLKQLYTFGSLQNVDGGVQFAIKNRLSDATVTALIHVKVAGTLIPLHQIQLQVGDKVWRANEISDKQTIPFPLRTIIQVNVKCPALPEGKQTVELKVQTKPFGKLTIVAEDTVVKKEELEKKALSIPREEKDDYSADIITKRQLFAEKYAGIKLKHLPNYSFDPQLLKGNIEHFTGVAQIPVGLAGPLLIDGEHAQGEFLIPLATTEGTLVASYNRGIKLLNQCGGAKCTISADLMQRAPVFVFDDARGARDFVKWIDNHLPKIREVAEATSSVAKLIYIDNYLSNKFAYLRFNFSTGDAAGQNMVGKATYAACTWAIDNYQSETNPIRHFYLESNFATDKKASQVNTMRTRGKRVTAEAIIPHELLTQQMRVTPESLVYHSQVANIGAFLSGANNNGLHSANAITAIFIATGQDVANVAESSAGMIFAETLENGDLYISITIPSLIVATYGGGTGLATQQECLNLLGCAGKGMVNKFAEIVAGVVLAGEISLAAAISSSDWVSSHEQLGRNR